jgi:transcription elongation GreA/GreB family factor
VFHPNIDKILKSFNSTKARLDAAADHYEEQAAIQDRIAYAAKVLQNAHYEQAARARKTSAKIGELLA